MKSDLNVDNVIIKGETVSNVAVLNIKDNSLYQLTDLDIKEMLFAYIDSVNNSDDIRVLLIKASSRKTESEAYLKLFRKILQTGKGQKCQFYSRGMDPFIMHNGIAKFCTTVSQIILKIVQLNKFVIHVDSGAILSPFMNFSLACDYRIIGENSLYKKTYLDLGLVPKGGSTVFLSRLIGFQKAYQILLSDADIPADEAEKLGIVDEVVPSGELSDRALKVALSYAKLPASSISGIKKLMNVSISELENCLESETELIFHIANSTMFREKLNTYVTDSI